jgi:hypothetical protein
LIERKNNLLIPSSELGNCLQTKPIRNRKSIQASEVGGREKERDRQRERERKRRKREVENMNPRRKEYLQNHVIENLDT